MKRKQPKGSSFTLFPSSYRGLRPEDGPPFRPISLVPTRWPLCPVTPCRPSAS